MENSTENIDELIRDYVGHHLRKNGVYHEEYAAVPSSSAYMSQLKSSIRLLCDQFQQSYNEIFNELCEEIEITPAKAKFSFLTVVDELFQEGVKIGRLVGLFSLVGALSYICHTKGNGLLIKHIIDWTNIYFMENLVGWIQFNRGWDELIHFADQAIRNKEAQEWPCLKHVICGIAASAIGIFALKTFLTSKS